MSMNKSAMNRLNVAILKNEDPYDHLMWVRACEEHSHQVAYTIIDLMSRSWLDAFRDAAFDCLLVRPGAKTSIFRSAYQERIEILAGELNYNIYPTLAELRIYENKRYLSYWLQANDIPHPKTWVFYDKKEALAHLAGGNFPLVGKTNVGSSGDGVTVLKNRVQTRQYIELAFGAGIRNRTGPKLRQKNLMASKLRKLLHPDQILNRLKSYEQIVRDAQKGFVIFQEYIPHEFEWRVVRIGDSFFGHKKIKSGDKASGTLQKGYEGPPFKLLDFVKSITDNHRLVSQAMDIFVDGDGRCLVNEMQCLFGQSDPYQMKVDERIGRYVRKAGRWEFEEGNFNQNESFNLRVAHILEMYGLK
jgi:glutathione synthase/RimK-type ligase-like ATP-grasp enzyme